MNKKTLVILAYVVAAVFVILAIVYFTTPANQLPSFLPGHDVTTAKTHFKHGLAAILLALGSAAYGWFQSGPKRPSDTSTPQ